MYEYLVTSTVYLVYDLHAYSNWKSVNYYVSKWNKTIWIGTWSLILYKPTSTLAWEDVV